MSLSVLWREKAENGGLWNLQNELNLTPCESCGVSLYYLELLAQSVLNLSSESSSTASILHEILSPSLSNQKLRLWEAVPTKHTGHPDWYVVHSPSSSFQDMVAALLLQLAPEAQPGRPQLPPEYKQGIFLWIDVFALAPAAYDVEKFFELTNTALSACSLGVQVVVDRGLAVLDRTWSLHEVFVMLRNKGKLAVRVTMPGDLSVEEIRKMHYKCQAIDISKSEPGRGRTTQEKTAVLAEMRHGWGLQRTNRELSICLSCALYCRLRWSESPRDHAHLAALLLQSKEVYQLQQLISNLPGLGADVETLKEIQELFQIYDHSGAGELDRPTFLQCMESAGWSREDAENIFDQVDTDGGGSVGLPEFENWWILEGSHKAGKKAVAYTYGSLLKNLESLTAWCQRHDLKEFSDFFSTSATSLVNATRRLRDVGLSLKPAMVAGHQHDLNDVSNDDENEEEDGLSRPSKSSEIQLLPLPALRPGSDSVLQAVAAKISSGRAVDVKAACQPMYHLLVEHAPFLDTHPEALDPPSAASTQEQQCKLLGIYLACFARVLALFGPSRKDQVGFMLEHAAKLWNLERIDKRVHGDPILSIKDICGAEMKMAGTAKIKSVQLQMSKVLASTRLSTASDNRPVSKGASLSRPESRPKTKGSTNSLQNSASSSVTSERHATNAQIATFGSASASLMAAELPALSELRQRLRSGNGGIVTYSNINTFDFESKTLAVNPVAAAAAAATGNASVSRIGSNQGAIEKLSLPPMGRMSLSGGFEAGARFGRFSLQAPPLSHGCDDRDVLQEQLSSVAETGDDSDPSDKMLHLTVSKPNKQKGGMTTNRKTPSWSSKGYSATSTFSLDDGNGDHCPSDHSGPGTKLQQMLQSLDQVRRPGTGSTSVSFLTSSTGCIPSHHLNATTSSAGNASPPRTDTSMPRMTRHVSISGATALSSATYLNSEGNMKACQPCPPLSDPPFPHVAEKKASIARRLQPRRQPSMPDMSQMSKVSSLQARDEQNAAATTATVMSRPVSRFALNPGSLHKSNIPDHSKDGLESFLIQSSPGTIEFTVPPLPSDPQAEGLPHGNGAGSEPESSQVGRSSLRGRFGGRKMNASLPEKVVGVAGIQQHKSSSVLHGRQSLSGVSVREGLTAHGELDTRSSSGNNKTLHALILAMRAGLEGPEAAASIITPGSEHLRHLNTAGRESRTVSSNGSSPMNPRSGLRSIEGTVSTTANCRNNADEKSFSPKLSCPGSPMLPSLGVDTDGGRHHYAMDDEGPAPRVDDVSFDPKSLLSSYHGKEAALNKGQLSPLPHPLAKGTAMDPCMKHTLLQGAERSAAVQLPIVKGATGR
ncbi:hypothetical protein CEUSTIGMA_g2207.t1 [Chlamydomonas eustigma]|uniref:EF-hand domain-containing protein n=1 Tax=Chlamydomonas eustigma TaxID=1157962 RepID=A0A250WW61_9CHLO|nr:hypothetical protein CEUSTIGMA_g2207.t1 [Chlamydomonas eustigma]|eukprot:GAX74760.1 hypothetical protein CEUSTIGMA_g2207.t1 [Chlamydomonas eustigma]